MECDEECRIFPKLSGLYDLVNLEHCYCKTMDIIIARVRDVMGRDYDCDDKTWKTLVNAPISTLVRAGEKEICTCFAFCANVNQSYYKEHPALTMKDVAERKVNMDIGIDTPSNRRLRKFLHKMDDDPYFSRTDKTRFMKEFSDLMLDLYDDQPASVNFLGDVGFRVGDF